jgi:hypothetical protein
VGFVTLFGILEQRPLLEAQIAMASVWTETPAALAALEFAASAPQN